MPDHNRSLKQMQLADALQAYPTPQEVVPPRSGWVRAIREALGMTQAQLGARVGVSRQSVQDFEKSESERRITLDSLDRLARAMECRVVYARDRYIKALRAADADNYGPLMAFVRA